MSPAVFGKGGPAQAGPSHWRKRIWNIGLWIGNGILVGVLQSGHLPGWAMLLVGFLVIEFLAYWVHRLYHTRWLWRFHALHHSDPDVDVTTAVRFHPLETLSKGAIYALALGILAIPIWVVTTHGLFSFVMALLTHDASRRWPPWLERSLEPGLITLDAHLLHHTTEGEGNYGDVLSVWDHAFGTYHWLCEEPVFGVQGFDAAAACRPLSMLTTPWRIR